MLVSIIIPTLNEAAVVAAALENADGLSGDKEVIVADGSSTDRTVEIASRQAKVVSGPRGRAVQMNSGAAAARGDVLLFLHADTILPSDALSAIKSALSDSNVIGGRFRVKLANPGWRYRWLGWNINARDRLVGGFTGDQAIFVRREVFQTMGGYREAGLMEDLDFARRMDRAGNVARMPQYVTTSARRWEKGGLIKTVFSMGVLRTLYYMNIPSSRLERWDGNVR